VGAAVGVSSLTRARAQTGAVDAYVGELRLFAGDYAPAGWLPCRGGDLDRDRFGKLADALGDAFGREGGKPQLPDLRGRALLGTGKPNGDSGQRVGDTGAALCVRDPGEGAASLGVGYIISAHASTGQQMIGEVRPFPYGFVPKDWLKCDGRELQIGQFIRLFSVIGPSFGGDGRKTFALPDLRGFTPLGCGDAPGLEPTPRASLRRGLADSRDARPPRLHMIHAIAHSGDYPSRDN
jgi:microcystin-dependent protein